MSKKEFREYDEKYGNVPNNYFERFEHIIEELKISDKDRKKIQDGIQKLLQARWETINFVFYFIPKATPRARLSGRTRTFYVRNASSNYLLFKDFIEEGGHDLGIITTPCKLLVDLFMPIPTNMSRDEKVLAELKLIYAISTPDWDNAGKTYSDMIQKSLLLTDSLICDGRVRKYYSFKPRIEIKIESMEMYDCKYNKKKIESWKIYDELIDKIEEKDHYCK
jgi:Holliday junction resolvase RusA-like endonuclease